MSPSSPNATEFFDLIGKLRHSAAISSRYGQIDELQRIADGLVRWQAKLRTEICRALEINPPTSVSVELMIETIRNEHQRAVTRPPWPLDDNPGWPSSPTADALNGVSKP